MNASFEYKTPFNPNKEGARFVGHFETLNNDKRKMNNIRTRISNRLTITNIVRPKPVKESVYAFDFNYPNKLTIDTIDDGYTYAIHVTKICNVYQSIYNNNKCVTGFGDFIRGCYFLLDFCDRHRIEFKCFINHPLSKCLKYSEKTPPIQLTLFTENNCVDHVIGPNKSVRIVTGENIDRKFKKYLVKQSLIRHDVAFVYNIVYPSHTISARHKYYMRCLLTPSDEIMRRVNELLNGFHLIKHNYKVIHIRSGDVNASPETFAYYGQPICDDNYIRSICREIPTDD